MNPKYLKEFTPSVDIYKRLRIIDDVLVEHKLYPPIPLKIPKNNEESLKARKEADKHSDIDKALECYNKSIAFATNNSEELSLGYDYRSKAFLKQKSYRQCVRDIRLIMDLSKHYWTIDLEKELLERNEYCKPEILKTTKLFTDYKEDIELFTKLSYPKHPTIPFIANCLELNYVAQTGRSIKANKDLKVGDVVAIEKPYTWCLHKNFIYRCCTYCLKDTFSLIPCPSCTMAMFCDKKCMKNAYEKFHKYECEIIHYLFEILRIDHFMIIRTLLHAISLFKDIDKLIDFEENTIGDTNIFTLDSHIRDDDNDNQNNEQMKKNYYPIYAITKGVNERKNLTIREYIIRTIKTLFIANAVFEMLKDLNIIKTHEHKLFIRKFIYNQFDVIEIYRHQLLYKRDIKPSAIPTRYGSAIYKFSGLLNHSCAPNIFRIYDGSTVTIIILRPIKRGEQLFESYRTDITNYCNYFWWTRKLKRQADLKRIYSFDCKCEACCSNKYYVEKSIYLYANLDNVKLITSDFKLIIEAIKKNFEKLNDYPDRLVYPRTKIIVREFKLMRYYSHFQGYLKQ